MPTYEEIAKELEMQIANIDHDYKKLITKMPEEREELQREVDNAINKIEREIGETKVKHHSLLKAQLDEIKQSQSLMHETLNALNEMEDFNEVYPIIHYSSKNDDFSKLPPKVNVLMPNFVPKQIERETLLSLIGKLSPLSTTLEDRVFAAKRSNA